MALEGVGTRSRSVVSRALLENDARFSALAHLRIASRFGCGKVLVAVLRYNKVRCWASWSIILKKCLAHKKIKTDEGLKECTRTTLYISYVLRYYFRNNDKTAGNRKHPMAYIKNVFM